MKYPSIIRDILTDSCFDVKIMDMHNMRLFQYNTPFVDALLDLLNKGMTTGRNMCECLNLEIEVLVDLHERYAKNSLQINFYKNDVMVMGKDDVRIFHSITMDDLYDLIKKSEYCVYAKFYDNNSRSIGYILEVR